MIKHAAEILEMNSQGLSAPKICQRLGNVVPLRSIQDYLKLVYGHRNPLGRNNSAKYAIAPQMRPYIEECFRQLGKDWYLCENCGERQTRKCDIHHTKYEGATIYDLQLVCRSCNLARVNVGLE